MLYAGIFFLFKTLRIDYAALLVIPYLTILQIYTPCLLHSLLFFVTDVFFYRLAKRVFDPLTAKLAVSSLCRDSLVTESCSWCSTLPTTWSR